MYNKGIDIILLRLELLLLGFDAVEEANKKTTNKFIIGVDSNQNHLAPGLVLTSMEKSRYKSIPNHPRFYLKINFQQVLFVMAFQRVVLTGHLIIIIKII